MVVKLNPDGKGVWDGVEKPDKVAKLNPDEEPAGSKTQPRFKPKVGSVIPAKRTLVKRMMFDWFVRSISGRPSVPKASQSNTTSGCSKNFPPPNSSNDKKRSVILAKQRSVKRMMFDYEAKSIAAHVFRPRPPPSSSALPQTSNRTANSCFKKSKPIFPHHCSVAIP